MEGLYVRVEGINDCGKQVYCSLDLLDVEAEYQWQEDLHKKGFASNSPIVPNDLLKVAKEVECFESEKIKI